MEENNKGQPRVSISEILDRFDRATDTHRRCIEGLVSNIADLPEVMYSVRYVAAFLQEKKGVTISIPVHRQYLHTDFWDSYNSFAEASRHILLSESNWENAAAKEDQLSLAMISVFKDLNTLKETVKKVQEGESVLLATVLYSGGNGVFTSSIEWTINPVIRPMKDCTIFKDNLIN